MKVDCPNTSSDINKIRAYKNLGNAYIEQGGSIKDIQKLFVENGGTLTNVSQDYPDYDDVEVNNEPTEEPVDYPAYDEVKTNNEPLEEPEDFPDYDEIEVNEINIDDRLLNSLSKKFRGANPGEFICWDPTEGFILSTDDDSALFKCVTSSYFTRDKYPRFMFMCAKNVQLGTVGNNENYEDYFFKVRNLNSMDNRVPLQVEPMSSYYANEEKSGREYTGILVKRNNIPAKIVKSLKGIDLSLFDDNTDMKESLIIGLKKYVYLPTLPELVKAIPYLAPGKYWTSSVYKNGTSNIILNVKPDNINITNDPNETANVVGFISFL